MGSEGVMGAEEDRGAAIYLMLDGQDTTGIGYMALWGFAAKCRMDGVDGYPLDCYDYQSTCGTNNHMYIDIQKRSNHMKIDIRKNCITTTTKYIIHRM